MQGWYWPYLGPANTMYVPGPLLKACNNELLLLEVGTIKPADATATGGSTPCASLAVLFQLHFAFSVWIDMPRLRTALQ